MLENFRNDIPEKMRLVSSKTYTCLELIELIDSVSTKSEIQSTIKNIRNTYGLKTVAYFGKNIIPHKPDEPYLAVTYSTDWIDHYLARNFREIDPVLAQGFKQTLPIDWSKFDLSSKPVKDFFGEAKEFGVGGNGFTIPVRSHNGTSGLFTVTDDGDPKKWALKLHDLKRDFVVISLHVHEMVCRTEGISSPVVKLGRREMECLKWASSGKTAFETSVILNISERTVRAYLDTARHKLNATNVTHAVTRAISTGLIAPI